MPRIRIAAAGAALLLLSGLTASGAAAQTATDQTAGQPLQLLRWLHLTSQASKPATGPRAKLADRKTVRTAAAVTKHRRPPTKTAEAMPPTSNWPADNAVAPTDATTMAPAPLTALTPGVPVPNELIVAGQTVQLASPEEVNELDIAANDTQPLAREAAPADTASPISAKNQVAEATSKSDSLMVTPQQPSASQVSSQVGNPVRSQVGTASWIAQVLAALGGAVAAGSVAWFLIGVTPQRTYG